MSVFTGAVQYAGMGLSFFSNASTPASYFQSSPSCVPCPSRARSSSPRATSPRAPTACPYRSGGVPGRATSRFRSLEPLPRMFSGLVPTAPLTAGLPPCYHHSRSCRCAMAAPPSPSQHKIPPERLQAFPGEFFYDRAFAPLSSIPVAIAAVFSLSNNVPSSSHKLYHENVIDQEKNSNF